MTEVLVQAFVFLAAAVLAVPIAGRLGLGSALGYLLAGVIIGPYVLGWVGQESKDVMHFAEYGVVLMLFLVGLELEPAKLWRLRVAIIGMGGIQVGVTGLVVAVLCLTLGLDWQMAVAVGLILALSSTAMVLQTLQEKGWHTTAPGRRAFSVLLFQDIAVIPILALMPLLAMPGAVASPSAADADRSSWLQALMVIGVVAGIAIAGRYLTRPIFRYIARSRSHEIFMATSLLLVVGITLVMHMVGLSPALGTFMAGVVLAESEFRHQLESNIEPFKGLLLGLFFLMVGAGIDFELLFSNPALIAGLVLGLVAVKFVILYFIGRFFRLALADSLLFAVALAQGGEFAFLLVTFALQSHALDPEIAGLLVLTVVLSMVLAPALVILFERYVQPRLAGSCDEREEDAEDLENMVIIAGYGRFGQIVGRMLDVAGFDATLLDHDAGQIELTGRFGHKVFYGDASRAELLEAAGIDKARVLVVAIDDKDKAVKMVETCKTLFPHVKVLARAVDRPHSYQLIKAGADYFVREYFGSALAMGEEALRALGTSDERARYLTTLFEAHDSESLYKLYEVWGDDEAYGFRLRQNLQELEKVLRDDANAVGKADTAAPKMSSGKGFDSV